MKRLIVALLLSLTLAGATGINGTTTSAQETTPALTIEAVMATAPDDTRSMDEFSLITSGNVTYIEYVRMQVSPHHYNYFHLETGGPVVSWCVEGINHIESGEAHIRVAMVGEISCGGIPADWSTGLFLSYPEKAWFSNSDAHSLMAALGVPDFRLMVDA